MRKSSGLAILVNLSREGRDRLRKLTAEQNLKNPNEFITPTEMAREIINQYLFRNGKESEVTT